MKMPAIGFGCSPLRAGGARVDLESAVREALVTGYRLFDVAELYGNESAIGRALRSSAAPPRNELFVIGKLWRTNFRPERVREACAASLLRLGLDAFDLYLMHAPGAWQHVAPLDDVEQIGWAELERRAVPRNEAGGVVADDVSPRETWAAMQLLVDEGFARNVGVSNFAPDGIAQLGSPLPAANEIACSPWASTVVTGDWCRERGVAVLGHSPLSVPLFEPKVLAPICKSIGRTPHQVTLRFLMQSGLTPLPSSAQASHIRENFAALDFALDREQIQHLETALANQIPA